MQIIREREAVSAIADPATRQMIQQRMDSIASDEPYDAKLHGYFAVISGYAVKVLAQRPRHSSSGCTMPYNTREPTPISSATSTSVVTKWALSKPPMVSAKQRKANI